MLTTYVNNGDELLTTSDLLRPPKNTGRFDDATDAGADAKLVP